MHFKTIVSAVVVIAIIQLTLAVKLENGKLYTIENVKDKTYLTAVDNGKLCKRRGDVITAILKSPSAKPQEWRYYAYTKGHLDYLVGEYGNEITMENKPPYCNYRVQAYKFTQIQGQELTVWNIDSKKCLAGAGVGKRITWEECQSATKKDPK